MTSTTADLVPPIQRQRNWALKALIAGAILLPLILASVIAFLTYRNSDAAADRLIQRTAAVLREHALKVFETAHLLAVSIEQLVGNLSPSEIAADRLGLTQFLRTLLRGLPQDRNIWVLDETGQALLSVASIGPAMNRSHADQPYFTTLATGSAGTRFVSRVLPGGAGDPNYFVISETRNNQDGFAGVSAIAVLSDYFEEVYADIAADTGLIAALVREDGAVLAIHPYSDVDLSQVEPVEGFVDIIANQRDEGTYNLAAGLQGGGAWKVAFYRIASYPIYVAVAISDDTVRADWLQSVGWSLTVALPFTVALGGIGFLALRRTRREASALARLRAETVRRELTEEQLRQASKMEAVGQLSGGIAHDFNNLLTAIGGNLELLKRRLDDESPSVDRLLRGAHEGVERAAALTQSLLAFSRRQALQPTDIDVNRLVTTMSSILHRTLGEPIDIEVVLGTGLWRTFVDANQLESALLNLAINARDAMPDGGRLTIETANVHIDEGYLRREGLEDVPPGQYVLLAVSDTGKGMSKEVIARAFEPFFTTKGPGEGTGLGLSMVYGFVKQSGGHAKIYSEEGHGTTVKLYLPRAVGATTSKPAASPVESPAPGRGEVILVVEDDPAVLAFEIETLEGANYRVRSARSGDEAIAALEADSRIDLLLTDVVLTGSLNGRHVAERAKAIAGDVGVLFVTGYTQNAIVHHGRLDPDVQLLSKPFSTVDLLRRIRAILDARSGAEKRPG